MKKREHFRGIFPYLVTPLDHKGRLKEGVLVGLIDHLISKGVHGLTPWGSTGEGAYLDWPTKRQVVKILVEAVSGRIPVVAAVTSLTTHAAVCEASETERLGADGILLVLPTYFPVDNEQVVAHFRTVARAVSCPVVLYTNPRLGDDVGWKLPRFVGRSVCQVVPDRIP